MPDKTRGIERSLASKGGHVVKVIALSFKLASYVSRSPGHGFGINYFWNSSIILRAFQCGNGKSHAIDPL